MKRSIGISTCKILFLIFLIISILSLGAMAEEGIGASSFTINDTIQVNGISFSNSLDKGAVNNLDLDVDVSFNGIQADGFVYEAKLEVTSVGYNYSVQEGIIGSSVSYSTTIQPNKTYTIKIDVFEIDQNLVSKLMDTRTFTYIVGDYDIDPPNIISKFPNAGEILESPPNSIVINLNESVSIVKSGIYIINKNTNEKVSTNSNIVHSSDIITINKTLAYGTPYQVVVEANAVKDLAGNSLPATSWDFITLVDPDATPTIISRTPTANASGVKINSPIKVVIDKELDTTTVNSTSISLKQGSTVIPVIIDKDNINGKGEITLTPTTNLNYNTTYTVSIVSNLIKDINGKSLSGSSWSFTTESGSLLTVTDRYPLSNATNVDVDEVISITFNNRLSSSTVSSTNIYLTKTGSSTKISAVLNYTDSTRKVTITPNSPLSYNTEYNVYITNNLKDTTGNNILATNWKFKTKIEDALSITDRNPKPNSMTHPVDGEITIKFSQPLQSSTVTDSNIYLRKSGSTRNISVDLKYTSSTRTVTITPESNLEHDTDYMVYLTNNIKDTNSNRLTAINWEFTTREEDPVVITERSPSVNAKNIDVDTEITIRFSQNMNQSTLNTTNIYLRNSDSSRNISTELSYNSSRRTVTVTPESPLEYYTEYTVYVTNRVKDTSGNALTAVNWSFETKETIPFEVIYNTPINNQMNLKVDSSLSVIFSGSLNQSTLNTANVYLKEVSSNVYVPLTLTYTNTDKKLTIKPQSLLSPNTVYNVYLTTGLKDDKGNSLKAFNWRFTTGAEAIRYGTANSAELKVSGKYVNFTDARPYVKNGRIFLPFRALFESIGATVGYDFSNAKSLKVWGTKDGNTVELFVGNLKAFRNGSVLLMDVKPELVDGRTMIPVRFAAEALGMKVTWDETTRTVIIE